MELVKQNIALRNPRKPAVQPLEIEALVDTGALHLCIPADIAERLELDLWISPALHQLVPNPASPDIPMSVAKGFVPLP